MAASTSKSAISKSAKCPCGSALKFIKCCGQYIRQGKQPLTAEALMRSRYTAYVEGDESYLLKTWHSSTRPTQLNLEPDDMQWTKLEINAASPCTSTDDSATVEFVAHFKSHSQKQQLHEVSRFVKEGGCWFYVDGDVS